MDNVYDLLEEYPIEPDFPWTVRERASWVEKRYPKMPIQKKQVLIEEIGKCALDVLAELNFSSILYIKFGKEVSF